MLGLLYAFVTFHTFHTDRSSLRKEGSFGLVVPVPHGPESRRELLSPEHRDMWWQLLHCGGPGSREHPEEKVDGSSKGASLPPPPTSASVTEAPLRKAPQPLKILPTAGETVPRHT